MSANLITGNGFSPITASMDADFQSGIVGDKTVILPIGSNMALSIEDANTIKADDGVIITKEGRRIQIDNGAVEEWTIPTGSQGQTKYYIVGFHIYTDDEANELIETFAEEVESASSTITENTLRGGATEVYVSVGRIKQIGVNLDSVTELIPVTKSIAEYEEEIAQISQHLTEKVGGDIASYTSIENVAYDSTNNKIILKVEGADTPIPFSGRGSQNTPVSVRAVHSTNTNYVTFTVTYKTPDNVSHSESKTVGGTYGSNFWLIKIGDIIWTIVLASYGIDPSYTLRFTASAVNEYGDCYYGNLSGLGIVNLSYGFDKTINMALQSL